MTHRAIVLASLLLAGCAASPISATSPPSVACRGPDACLDGKCFDCGQVGGVGNGAQKEFDDGVHELARHDAAGDWDAATCAATRRAFEAARDAVRDARGPLLVEAEYDIGLVHQRCGEDAPAKAAFQRALDHAPKLHYARAELALYQYAADGNIDRAIAEEERAIFDSEIRDVPALADLAMLQMRRDSPTSASPLCKAFEGGEAVALSDFECAKLNLRRALALDDAYMPARNQLALYYFARAKRHGGAPLRQELDLAALACSQAIARAPRYAPIHNTAALVLFAMGDPGGAARELETAVSLDRRLFEAQVNLGDVSLSFRGWPRAARAFRDALALRPNDYDAHLGLALALRGELPLAPTPSDIAAVHGELATCERLDPARPDAYFNEAILTAEYEARADGKVATLARAKALFQTFLAKAGDAPSYAAAAATAKERIADGEREARFIEGK